MLSITVLCLSKTELLLQLCSGERDGERKGGRSEERRESHMGLFLPVPKGHYIPEMLDIINLNKHPKTQRASFLSLLFVLFKGYAHLVFILVQACLRARHVVADEVKLAIVFTYFLLA